jgi:hypothetical protein
MPHFGNLPSEAAEQAGNQRQFIDSQTQKKTPYNNGVSL